VNINSTVEKDYLLLKKYTEYFRWAKKKGNE
jgi:hypothetical protein